MRSGFPNEKERDQQEKMGGKAGSEKPIVDAQHSSQSETAFKDSPLHHGMAHYVVLKLRGKRVFVFIVMNKAASCNSCTWIEKNQHKCI